MAAQFDVKKVLISDPIDPICVSILKQAGIAVDEKKLSKEDLIKQVNNYDALIVRSGTKVTKDVIEAADSLKIIGRAGTGVDNIDVQAATKKGIIVMNTPAGNTISAAEHTCAMVMAMARKIQPAGQSLKEGRWDRKAYMGVELQHKVLGILGLGRIGREVATRLQSFGMECVGYDPIIPKDVAAKFNIESISLDEVLKRADFITIHTPLIKETENLINDETIAKCKKGVFIVNCARGGIIDEAALLRGLNSGHVASAALDVFINEPPTDLKESPLLKHPNLVCTPHLGASTVEAQNKVAREIAVQIVSCTQGKEINGAVNAPALVHATNPALRPWILLAIKLGSLGAQLLGYGEGKSLDQTVHIESIFIHAQGKKISNHLPMLKSAILTGLLTHLCEGGVNLVNAASIAGFMNLSITEQQNSDSDESYSNLLSLECKTKTTKHLYAGTVFKSNPRVVCIDGHFCEVVPDGTILVLKNEDRPGVAANVGSVIAKTGTNIGFFSLGRTDSSTTPREDSMKHALTVVGIDSPLESSAITELRDLEGIEFATQVTL